MNDDISDELADVYRTAIVAACRSSHHLLDWDEYRNADAAAEAVVA